MQPARFDAVVAELAPITAEFARAGRRLYIVGGTVRDLLLGRDLAALDFDFTTDAQPDEVKSLLGGLVDALWTQGERFGTIAAKRGERTLEITTHRAEAYVPDSRKPEVEFADDITVDLSRRDFTVNALYYDPSSQTVLDYHDGVADLKHKTLRMIGDPRSRYREDPVRMLRAVRLSAKLGLTLDPAVRAPIHDMADQIGRAHV